MKPSRNLSANSPPPKSGARTKLLGAAIKLVRKNGFSATSVDQLCAEAGVSKGAFFHHFTNKDALGAAAADYWTETSSALFMKADYNRHDDPLDRYFGYLDFREEIATGAVEEFTCYAGTSLQECYGSSDAIRGAAYDSIAGHSARLAADLDQAIAKYGAPEGVTGMSLGSYTQAALQGAFILAKGRGNATPVHEAISHLRRYAQMLFTPKFKERSIK
ncbi:MAG: TetR/AcrR family transcriptional regulator [Parasphingorhabdus sp.]|uniref:TetR/AcrR family transcriptional regulator n=1 Tax=Parasphingorhabdus sp. TaxID=2709688 RepID=UPI00300149E4